jgi:hypothetical protein
MPFQRGFSAQSFSSSAIRCSRLLMIVLSKELEKQAEVKNQTNPTVANGHARKPPATLSAPANRHHSARPETASRRGWLAPQHTTARQRS